jgi:hypothetical protein
MEIVGAIGVGHEIDGFHDDQANLPLPKFSGKLENENPKAFSGDKGEGIQGVMQSELNGCD